MCIVRLGLRITHRLLRGSRRSRALPVVMLVRVRCHWRPFLVFTREAAALDMVLRAVPADGTRPEPQAAQCTAACMLIWVIANLPAWDPTEVAGRHDVTLILDSYANPLPLTPGLSEAVGTLFEKMKFNPAIMH